MIKLKPVHKPDGALVRILGNVTRGLLVLLCLVAWMPSPATASQPETPTLNSVSETANLGELKVTWSWTDNNSDSCPMGGSRDHYTIYYKKTTGVTWDFITDNPIDSNNPNNANRGMFSFRDLANNTKSVTSKGNTINRNTRGVQAGETGVSLESVSYDIKMEVYSESGNCDFSNKSELDDDEDNYSAYSNEISATPNTAPTFASTASIANLSLIQSSAMTSVTLPAATGGNGDLSYTITPALPEGLSLSDDRVLSGTPTGTSANTTYTYTVSDGDDFTTDTDTITFTITVDVDSAPAFASNVSIADLSLIQSSAMTSVTLPAATGGNGPRSYSITPTLPGGLSFNASTRVLSGTPTGKSASVEYTYTVSDADNNTASTDTDTITFDITVDATDSAPSFANNASIANLGLTQNTAMTESQPLPEATGGNGDLSYEITPSLPAGLSFNASTRVLSGTPTGTSANAPYTYTVSDADNNTASTDTDTITFTIAVDATDSAPAFANNASIANQSLIQNAAMTSVTLPYATGGNGTLSYSISPTLPAGLSFNIATRVLSGTPTGESASVEYTYTVTDADNNTASTDKATIKFTITVDATDSAPAFANNASIANQSLIQNSAMTSVTLPEATGGNGALSYSLSPALPSGLNFNTSTRVLSGTPTAAQGETTYTYTVSDADNNTASTDKATLTFKITVEGSEPSFGSSIPDQIWTQHATIPSLILPRATEGSGALRYSISPSPPTGVSFSSWTRMLSGTPTAAQGETTYVYRVSDRNNNTASLTFTITVIAEKCSVSNVKDEDEDSLKRFVECAAQRIADSDTFWDTLELLESFREDGGNWRDGSTHLVLLTAGGGVYFHAEDRETEDLDWSGAVSCEGGESVLKSKQGCFIEYEGKKNGYAHRFTASQIPLVQGSGEFVLLGGSYGSPEGEAFSGEIDGPMTKASDVDRDEDLTEFVEEAGRAVKEGIEDSDIDPAELRGILRGEGEWREGEVSVYILEENGRVIFHGGDREREQKDEYVKYKDIIEYTGAVVVEYMEGSELMRGYAEKVEISAGGVTLQTYILWVLGTGLIAIQVQAAGEAVG